MSVVRLSILSFALFVLASQVEGVKRVRVEAGNRNLDDFIILYGNDGSYLSISGNEEMESGPSQDMGYSVRAKVENYNYDHIYSYGPHFYYDYGMGRHDRHSYSAAENRFFGNDGPDAVAECQATLFYFKGCQVVKGDGWTHPMNVHDLGLPCNPDAAWKTSDGNGMTVLKGDQVWSWDCHNRASGQQPFHKVYKVYSWQLIP